MGLDLILYRKSPSIPEERQWEDELAYGRKTWGIANFFIAKCQPEYECYDFEITKEAWDEFIANITPYFYNKHFKDFIESYSEFEEDATDEVEVLIEQFLDSVLDDGAPYTLGPAWEARALLRWYEADREVQECFKNDIPVGLIVSY